MTDFINKLPKNRQHYIMLAKLFVIPLVLFFDITLGGKELQRHDITQFRAAYQSVVEYKEQYGDDTFWAANSFGGMPSYVLSIPKAVPHLDNAFSFFRKLYPAAQYWVLLGGTYFFLTLMGFRPLASALGSLMFGLTSYFAIIIIAGHTSKFVALAFIPWVLAGYWLLFKKEKKLAGTFLLMAAMALEIRAGHPQITYYFFYLIGLLYLADSWEFIKEKKYTLWAVLTGLLFVGVAVGVLGSAERFLALKEYSEFSIRGGSAIKDTSTMDTGYAFGWSQGISETLTLLVPDFFGGASPDYWGPKSFTSGPHYFGVVGFLFFIIALFKVRTRDMYVFLASGTLGILFAWGGNFLILNQFAFNYIPFFDKFRAPETWLVLTIFCYSVVAVYGFDWLADFVGKKSATFKNLYAPLGTAIGVFVLLFAFASSTDYVKFGEVQSIANQIAQQNNVPANNPQVQAQAKQYVETRMVPTREEKARKDVTRFGILIILSIGFVYLLTNGTISITIAGLAFIVILGLDQILVDQRYMPERSFVASNVDTVRLIESQRRDLDQFIEEHISENSAYPYRVFPLLDNPFSNATPAYFYPILGGYTAAKLSTFQDVFMTDGSPLFAGPAGINLPLLEVLNTKYITYQQPLNAPGISVAFRSQSGVVLELTNVLPKAFFVDSVITTYDPKAAYDLLFPGKMDFATTAVVEGFEPQTTPDSTSRAEVVDYTGSEITIKTSRSTPGFLVLSEMFYPEGWQTTIDGTETEIYKTNYLLRGIQVPAGEHTIELAFRPSSIAVGNTLSRISLGIQVLLGLALAFGYFKNKNAETN